MSKLHGAIIYRILEDNSLFGIWTNNDHKNIYHEKAEPIERTEFIIGRYNCFYTDHDRREYSGTLNITRPAEIDTFDLEWTINNGTDNDIKFYGIGFIFENNKLVVSYTDRR